MDRMIKINKRICKFTVKIYKYVGKIDILTVKTIGINEV